MSGIGYEVKSNRVLHRHKMLDTFTLSSLAGVGGEVQERANVKTAGCRARRHFAIEKTKSTNYAFLDEDCGDCPSVLRRPSVLPTVVQKNALHRHPKDVRTGGEDGPQLG